MPILNSTKELHQTITNNYSHHQNVVGVTLCGSVNKSLNDNLSDLDIFVYVGKGVKLSPSFVRGNFIIPNAQVVQKKFNVEQNYVVHRKIINVKFFSIEFLDQYRELPVQWDDLFLEQIENILTMRVVFDKKKIISGYKKEIKKRISLDKNRLIAELVDRYGNLIWRSVYQGLYRNERLSCFTMLINAVDILSKLCYLGNNKLPAPVKWRWSDRLLLSLHEGTVIKKIYQRLLKTDYQNSSRLMRWYNFLRSQERKVLRKAYFNGRQRWWWHVFAEERISRISHAVRKELKAAGLAN